LIALNLYPKCKQYYRVLLCLEHGLPSFLHIRRRNLVNLQEEPHLAWESMSFRRGRLHRSRLSYASIVIGNF